MKVRRFSLHYSLILILLLMIYTGLYKTILSLFLCIVLHETLHIITALLFKCKVSKLTLTMVGGIVDIKTEGCNNLKKLIIYSSGVLANGVILLISKDETLIYFNRLMIIFNLLPIYPLDGFSIIEALFSSIVNTAKLFKVQKVISITTSIGIILLSVYWLSMGLLIIGMFLLGKNISYYSNDYNLLKRIIPYVSTGKYTLRQKPI